MNAVDYAIHYKFPEVALAMVTHPQRANEVLALKSEKHPCVTLALIASMPKVFESVQDSCIIKANCKKDSKSFYVRLFLPHKKKPPNHSFLPDQVPLFLSTVSKTLRTSRPTNRRNTCSLKTDSSTCTKCKNIFLQRFFFKFQLFTGNGLSR